MKDAQTATTKILYRLFKLNEFSGLIEFSMHNLLVKKVHFVYVQVSTQKGTKTNQTNDLLKTTQKRRKIRDI